MIKVANTDKTPEPPIRKPVAEDAAAFRNNRILFIVLSRVYTRQTYSFGSDYDINILYLSKEDNYYFMNTVSLRRKFT